MVGSNTSLLLWTRGICRGWPGEEEEGGPGYTWPGVWNLTLQAQSIAMNTMHLFHMYKEEAGEKMKIGEEPEKKKKRHHRDDVGYILGHLLASVGHDW